MRCLSPVTIKDEVINKYVEVPCGKCVACLSNRRREWACRLSAELRNCASAYFITLTYDDSHRPIAEDKYVLLKKDVQDFLKRLRKRAEQSYIQQDGSVIDVGQYRIKYVCVGEYGVHTYLPHFHISIFNLPWSKEKLDKVLSQTWQHGIFHVGEVNSRSAMYEFKYLLKNHQQFPDDDIRNTDFPTFMTCSKGIGASFLTPEMVEYLKRGKPPNEYNLVPIDRNEYALPRYFRKKLHPDKLTVNEHYKNYHKSLDNSVVHLQELERKYGNTAYKVQFTQGDIITRNTEKIYRDRNKL